MVSADRGGRNKDQGGKKKVAARVVIKTRISLLEILSCIFGGGKGKSKQLAWGWKGTKAGMFCPQNTIQNTVHCSLDLYVYRVLYVLLKKLAMMKKKREVNRYFCFHRIWTAEHLLIFFFKEKLMFCGLHIATKSRRTGFSTWLCHSSF